MNALGIDVEEWYHISGLDFPEGLSEKFESRIVVNTEKILDLLNRIQTKATFFVLGVIAERFPDLIKKINSDGHEIASHGYMHKEIHKHSKESFREDIRKSISVLRSITGKAPWGYRAPNFSIIPETLWALDILADEGFCYDCSVFPVYHPRYGIPSSPRNPHHIRENLLEFPPSTIRFLGQNFSVAGGAYFRILPLSFTKKAFRMLIQQKQCINFYLHVWELDSEQPKLGIPPQRKLLHYYGLDKTQQRFENLLRSFHFSTIESVLKNGNLTSR